MDWDESQKLLLRWQLRRIAYFEQLNSATDPDVARTIIAMDFQLGKCIDELSDTMDGEESALTRRLLAGIQNTQEKNDDAR